MRYYILAFLLVIGSCTLRGQSNDTWTAFWNEDNTLIGYKNKEGMVKIKPKFTGLTSAKKFDYIIAATENINENWASYFITKTGRIVGRDSLHIFDNGFDCESEGFIRFRDKKTDKTGMFNRNGDIVIPAEYNELTRVRHGMIIAIKNAEKKYWEGGEHYSWIGGQEILIDTNNNVLIDSFKLENNLNLFSVSISKIPNPDTLKKNFKAVDGRYYSFVDFNKEFTKWLKTNLLDNFAKENLIKATYDKITWWESTNGWKTEAKGEFIERNYELIKSKLLETTQPNCKYYISSGGLNSFMFQSDDFAKYYNNCGESKDWIYPTMTVIISHTEKGDITQDQLEFLRTDLGYKLLCITINAGKIK